MKKITLFVGDCDESLAQTAKQFDCEAVLVDQNNCTNFINSASGFTGYTSLADLPKDLSIFYNLLLKSDSIVYCPPTIWSDRKGISIEYPTTSIQGLTEWFLKHIHKLKNNVSGLDFTTFDKSKYLRLIETRKTDKENLWVVGCSTTLGIGIDPQHRYGSILSKLLNLPVSFLAAPGASISWAADQILRSDIKSNDIVVWGLTAEERLTFWDERKDNVVHITNQFDEVDQLSADAISQLVLHKTNLANAIQKVHEVVNFCNKVNAKLLIFNIHSSESLAMHIYNINNFFLFVYPTQQFIDVGFDQFHPGPKQHQEYADFCQSALKKLQYI